MRGIQPLIFALLTLGSALPLNAQIDRITGKNFATRSEVLATHGMVCTSVPAATEVGVEILKHGGSAVDAAIAANATLGLMEPVSNGIGGDLFAIVYSAKENKLYGINGSGRSPLGLSYDAMKSELAKLHSETIPPRGMLPISVPGTVDAWAELHQKFGKLKLSDDLAPAIRYAEQGFPVTDLIAYYWSFGLPLYKGLPGAFLETYTLPMEPARLRAGPSPTRREEAPSPSAERRTPGKGDIFKNPDLARTLRLIGEKGREAFYRGEIADKIDTFMRANGGFLRKTDFEKHTSTWVEPVSVNYRGYDIFELPPNGQGISALQILNILEGFDLRAMGRNSPETVHTMIEAKKIAWADRAKFYADPAFAKIPIAGLLSKGYAAERRKLIDPDHAAKQVAAGNPALDQGDTIYMCTADDEGNMVSLIQSNYRGMGSGIVVPGLGFMFQDRGELFSMDPQHANVYAPGKRPFHTIIPGFVMKDGKPWEAFGVMGGGMQPQGHVQVLTNQIDFGLNVQEAGDASRWQHEGDNEPTGEKMNASGGYVEVESGIPYETVRELRKKGHDVRFDVGGYGGYQAIKVEMHDGRRVYVGASESRKDGMAAGY
ncbi:MAG TPA: gamma-glutamyltransferase family protein [Candidatus Udaeobacter sp.]|jgi:gamma-glutamyltranspeptidase/glutathione hydrolase|nr:gamma-glutamyltransferase family protein [Candidatus Udaeobacter sp.]